ncbi:MAG: hypothetical protein GC154_04525 [bacterium]|nr:hypothetical protein [bacterium]
MNENLDQEQSRQAEQSLARLISRFFESRLPSQQWAKIDLIVEQITIPNEERKQTCDASLERARHYLACLGDYQSASTLDTERHYTYLISKQEIFIERLGEFASIRMQLSNILLSQGGLQTEQHGLIRKFIDASLAMMVILNHIIQREVEIGETLAMKIQEYLRKFIRKISPDDPQQVILIAKTMKVLQSGKLSAENIRRLNYVTLQKSLEKYQEKLEHRHQVLEALSRIIQAIQESTQHNDSSHQTQTTIEAPSETTSESSSRMARSTAAE